MFSRAEAVAASSRRRGVRRWRPPEGWTVGLAVGAPTVGGQQRARLILSVAAMSS